MLKDRGIPAHVLETEKAVRLFNELREKEAVGGLFAKLRLNPESLLYINRLIYAHRQIHTTL
jgi:hypothetical protein